jgi:hypothetical protein
MITVQQAVGAANDFAKLAMGERFIVKPRVEEVSLGREGVAATREVPV